MSRRVDLASYIAGFLAGAILAAAWPKVANRALLRAVDAFDVILRGGPSERSLERRWAGGLRSQP